MHVFFCLLLNLIFFAPSPAHALTWSWSSPEKGVERLRLHLDAPAQGAEVFFAGDKDLIFYINSLGAPLPPLARVGNTPAAGALVKTVELANGRLRVQLSAQAASIVRRPAPDRLDIEFFAAGSSRGEQPFAEKKSVGGFWSFWPLSEAHAATRESVTPGGQNSLTGRQAVVGKVNTGGPEDWPENRALSTVTQPVQPDAAAPLAGEKEQGAAREAGGTSVDTSGGKDAAIDSAAGKQMETGRAVPSSGGMSAAGHQPASPAAARGPVVSGSVQSTPSAAATAAPGERPAAEPATPGQGKPFETGAVSGKVNEQTVGLPAVRQPEEEASKEPEERPVIYVDEQGNPVPRPINPEIVMEEAERLIRERKYIEALPQLEKLRSLPGLHPEMLEKALYYISDCTWARYADNPLAGYEAIVSSTSEAMNANLRSPRVPEALLRLGLANVNVGNLVDAGGYIVALLRRYPDYPGVAQGFTALGKAQLKRGLDERAEQSFSMVLDKYPESSYLQEASVGLAEAFNKQKKFQNAHLILDFISKRWPRYYIDEPSFLLLQAGNDEALGKTGPALGLYWLYYNLVPGHEGNDELLLRLGDMYARQGGWVSAEFVYRYVERTFAGTASASVARLRLAEKGIYDSPINYAEMSAVFARDQGGALWKVYTDLAASSRTAPAAVLARLKEAMWLYWDKKYTEAMGKAAYFIDAYPENTNVPQAKDLIWASFQQELNNSLAEGNYGRILILWNGFPLVRERYGALDPRMRYALAQGMLERGDEAAALGMMADFLKSPMDPNYGEAAFTEFFNRYLRAGAWDKVLDLGKLVSTWPMNKQLRNQLDYALALSAQNLNLTGPALAMWAQLADRQDIPLYQRAYATYFLARDAEQRKDIKGSYELNRKVIDLFTRLQDERSDKADPQRIKDAMAALMDISEVANRVPEALEWVGRYNAYAPPESPEYPGLRFREARLYRKLGDAARAQALLEDVVRNYPNSPFAQAAAGELRTFEVSRDLQNFLPGGSSASQQPAPGQAQEKGSAASAPAAAQ
ncbi:tetratricopeptide repeat protein [Desulfovibrio sp.]|uniref:tetratricopeptide repeat protein n=1 Tax=Desulfovibrio sp. TaxID=885 RepID=UPI0025C303D6|nr:tetratricopeptide repeat protein [Desulfovibrio sp.]